MAQELLHSATIGMETGDHSQEAYDALDAEVSAAEAVYAEVAASQEAIDAAYADLQAAMNVFEAAEIT